MSTTYLLSKNKILNEEDKKQFQLLGEEVKELIALCKSISQIIILTNSTRTCVLSSSEKYLLINADFFKYNYILNQRKVL